MDERASSALAQGNSLMAQQTATERTLSANIGRIKQGYERLNQANVDARVGSREEDTGIDAKDAFTAIGDIRRFGDSVGRAKQKYEQAPVVAERARLMAEGRGASIVDKASLLANPPSKVGTAKTFVSPSFQAEEAGNNITGMSETLANVGAEGEADTPAKAGIGRLIQRGAELAGETGKSAAAIGDVVGHGLGLATAGYGIVKDVSGGWSTMDKQQKAGNVLGIAGGIADAVSTAIPIFTPLAVGLNIASAVEDREGDEAAPEFQKTKQGGLDDQQKADVGNVQATMKIVTPTAAMTTGQIATHTAPLQGKGQSAPAVF